MTSARLFLRLLELLTRIEFPLMSGWPRNLLTMSLKDAITRFYQVMGSISNTGALSQFFFIAGRRDPFGLIRVNKIIKQD